MNCSFSQRCERPSPAWSGGRTRSCGTGSHSTPFHARHWAGTAGKHWQFLKLWLRYSRVSRAIRADPKRRRYMDEALTPVTDEELGTLEMFAVTEGAKAGAYAGRVKPRPRAAVS